ncbi:MAG: thiamine pyrophosphate-dependent enzyme, partial [Geminicoccaceae bacterium]
MRRYELLQDVAPIFDREFVICNLGFPSQELYSLRDSERFFYMLGSMGLSSSIGLGLATQVDETVVSIDGDGSVLMNLGTLSTIARAAPRNFILLIVDNGSYGSTGDQPTQTAQG